MFAFKASASIVIPLVCCKPYPQTSDAAKKFFVGTNSLSYLANTSVTNEKVLLDGQKVSRFKSFFFLVTDGGTS